MGWGVSPTPRPPLLPGNTRYPFYRRLGGPRSRSGQAENLFLTVVRSRTVQPVVSRYTDWATRFVVDYPVLIPWRSAVSVSCISKMKILQEVSQIQNFMIHVLLTRQTNGKHVKSFRATAIILESKKAPRRHAITEEEWTKLMPNRDISEEFTGSTYTANGRVCIIQNGPQ